MAEGKLFKCPTCGSSLAPDGNQANIKCEYCGNNVIVPPELRQADPVNQPGSSPISIVMNDGATSIQMPGGMAFQPKGMNIVLDDPNLSSPANITLPSSVNRWIKFSIWMFVIITIVSVVIPLVCSFFGIFGAMAGAFLPFFLK